MARKLLYGNEIVSFTINTTPTTKTGTLIVKGIIPAEKVLIINDVTNNTSIYTFSDPLNTITCTPSYTEKQTTITISSLPESTTTSSDLELFIEREEVEIKPSRTYRDPVSKFRVSQAESIIDTDFEYGLQPTKWETLRTVNNIPTYYSSIFSEDAISAVSIKVESGNVNLKLNDQVTVTTTAAHNLVKGSIIEITGLTDTKYEGVYIVNTTPSTTQFTYRTSFVSGKNISNIRTIYTLIYPGSFYTGSAVEVSDIEVQTGAASTLTAITPNIHGIKDTTKLYLKQSRAVKNYEFISNTTDLQNSDVVGFGTTSQTSLINASSVYSSVTPGYSGNTATNQNIYYANRPIIDDDWIGKYEANFQPGDVSVANDTISYNLANQVGSAYTEPIKVGETFMLYSAKDNQSITTETISGSPTGYIAPDTTFRVFTVLPNSYSFNGTGAAGVGIVTFKFTSVPDSSAVQGIAGAGSTDNGNHRLVRGLRVQEIGGAGQHVSGQNRIRFKLPTGSAFPFAAGDRVVFCSNTSVASLRTSSFNDYSPTNYTSYQIISGSIILPGPNSAGVGTFNVGLNEQGSYFWPGGSTISGATIPHVGAFAINQIPLANSIYLPPTAGFSTTPFASGDYIGLTTTGQGQALPYIGPDWYTSNGYALTNLPRLVGRNLNATQVAASSARGYGAPQPFSPITALNGQAYGAHGVYILNAISGYTNWFKLHPPSDNSLATPLNIVIPSGQVANAYGTNTFSFNRTINRIDENTIRLKDQPKFNDNQEFLYAAKAGSTPIGGLSDPNYFAKSDDTRIENKFRVQQSGKQASFNLVFARYPCYDAYNVGHPYRQYLELWLGPGREISQSVSNGQNVHTAGITTGAFIQITGFPENGGTGGYFHNGLAVSKFMNQVFRVTRFTSAGGPGNDANFPGITTYSAYNATRVICEVPQGDTLPGIHTSIGYFNKGNGSLYYNIPGVKVTGITTFSSVGVGTQVASLNTIGIVDDIYPLQNGSVGQGVSFVFQTNFEVPPISQNVVGGANTIGINTVPAWIRLPKHLFADGAKVTYTASNPSSPIGELTSGSDYYVRVLDGDHIGLTSTAAAAINRTSNDSLINFTSVGAGVTHTFTTTSAKGFIIGNGGGGGGTPYNDYVGFATGSNIVYGFNNTTFLSDFANGDVFRIYQLKSGVGPGTYFQSKIVSVKSNATLQLEDIITNDVLGVPNYNQSVTGGGGLGIGTGYYFIPTRAYVLSDAKAVHRPFDGGVAMSSGITPNSKIIRQTRRYFRYQSGKGIQCSMAINFNPTYDIETVSGIGTIITVASKFPHGIAPTYTLNPSNPVDNQRVKLSVYDINKDSLANAYNGTFDIRDVIDDFKFRVNYPNNQNAPSTQDIGFVQYNVLNWRDSALRAGMFDDQNGFFYKYDGETLYAVRRSSTQQLSGTCTISRNEYSILGTDTVFTAQLSAGDTVIIRGQTYKVINVDNDTKFQIQPAYRGQDSTNVIISKVIDTEIPQSQWNLDRCDGTGPSGYNIDVNRIQMIYMDYSWYGAGSIRFGFKNQDGEVMYAHEFLHNNSFTESYFRSGNLPARYEVQTGDNPGFGPSLFHWGVSVMMDGRFDDDKAYLFTADSNVLPFTNGGYANNGTGTKPAGVVSAGSSIITSINKDEAEMVVVGEQLEVAGYPNAFLAGTVITGIEIDTSTEANKQNNVYTFTASRPSLQTLGNQSLNIYSGTAALLKTFIPLVSIRLSPSVDNATTGNLGYRDIINRMQLTLKSAGVLTTHDCEVRLVLNPRLSRDNWTSVGSPSLAQIYKHNIGDTYGGGTVIYSFRAQGGSVINTTSARRSLNVTSISLNELALLGNAILGGDGVYPDGPDVLTVAFRPVNTAGISGAAPLIISSRISWAEAQA